MSPILTIILLVAGYFFLSRVVYPIFSVYRQIKDAARRGENTSSYYDSQREKPQDRRKPNLNEIEEADYEIIEDDEPKKNED